MIGFVHKHSFVSSVQKSFRFLFTSQATAFSGGCIFFRFFPAFAQTFFPAYTPPHEKETGKETIKKEIIRIRNLSGKRKNLRNLYFTGF